MSSTPLLLENNCEELSPHPLAFYSLSHGVYYLVNRSEDLKQIKKGDIKTQYFQEHGEGVPVITIGKDDKADYPNVDPVFAPGVFYKYFRHNNSKELYWNTFQPTKYMLGKTDTKETEIPFVINGVLDNLFLGEPEAKDHFINWVSYIFNTRNKTRIGYLFRGEAGAGKGLFFDAAITNIFGEGCAGTATNDQLLEKFNSYIKDKLFVAFNEIGGDRKERKKVQGKIKEMITDSVVQVREMRQNSYSARNHANFMFFSNEESPVNIDLDDRRFCAIRTGGNLEKLDWFKSIKERGEDPREQILKESAKFASFLINYPYSERRANVVFDTQERQNIIQSTEKPAKAFAHAIINVDYGFFEELFDDLKQTIPQNTEFGVRYSDDKTDIDKVITLFNSGWEVLKEKGVMPKGPAIQVYSLMGERYKKMTPNLISRSLKSNGLIVKNYRNIYGEIDKGYIPLKNG